MNLDDDKNSFPIQVIERLYSLLEDWEKIKTLEFLGNATFDYNFSFFKTSNAFEVDYTQEEWFELVDAIKERRVRIEEKDEIIAKNTRNNAKSSTNPRSAWGLYRKKLKMKGWNDETVRTIQHSSENLLQMLSKDTTRIGPIKGLVLGNVQSGKTANMAGLISMAADYGFNCFIVLSGMIESLRKQTQDRLADDVVNTGSLDWQIIEHPHPNRPRLKIDSMDKLELSNDSRKRYLTVALKNSSRLSSLLKWLYSSNAQAKNLKVLIIDDEADQASINTKKINFTNEEETERTKINDLIIKLVHGYDGKELCAVNYISYTATPYANVLNDASKESLYPSDFILALAISPDYIGPKKLFGLEEPNETEDIPIVRTIPEEDVERIKDINDGYKHGLPKSLRNSLQWYLASSMAMQLNGYKSPISMLIHVSQKINSHGYMEEQLIKYFNYIKEENLENFLKETKLVYLTEIDDFRKDDFIEGMPDYSKSPEEIPEYPEWRLIEEKLRILFYREKEEFVTKIPMDEDGALKFHRGIHLCIDNSSSNYNPNEHVRLVYPYGNNKPNHATLFIVIGGNTLSRGLTLEGLTTSYFMRNTLMSDTLMQMGRWFGYRPGYEVFPRIWMNEVARNRFKFVTQLDQELRETIQDYAERNASPSDYGVVVKNSANNALIQVTSSNKRQAARETDMDFQGISKQTIVFEDIQDNLNHNINITTGFLNSLDKPEIKGARMVWKNVDFNKIKKDFLSEYVAPKTDIMFSNLDALIEWCDALIGEDRFDEWNVVLSSKGEINSDHDKSDWIIKGHGVSSVNRSVLSEKGSEPKLVNIGALRAPKDLLTDITEEEFNGTISMKEVRKIRREHNIFHIPQLVIYRIDKNSTPKKKTRKNNRKKLNFSQDIIGISIMIPGKTTGKNLAKNLSIKIEENNDIEVEE